MIGAMSEPDVMMSDDPVALRSQRANDTLFNLTLLNAVAMAVLAWTNGLSVGQCFGIGMAVILVFMPMILSLSWLILRLSEQQDNHAKLANIILAVLLVLVVVAVVVNAVG